MPMEGKLLAGRYEIQHILGSGGMATVYKAFDTTLERDVAIKVMNQGLAHDREFVRRFVWEAQATGRLSHPNIVNVYDAGQEGPLYYMVMEYVEGVTLKHLIQERGRLSAKEAFQIATQICDGLSHAHSHGIIHRDIKPHNIMCTSDGRYKVADFGIARLLRNSTNLTRTGTVMGSIHYFSPEQARGQEIGYPSDLYSLGIVLYEMGTGEVPFHANEDIAVALMHIQTPVPDPRKLNPALPIAFTEIVQKAMEKNPNKRFQTAQELKQAILQASSLSNKEKTTPKRRVEMEQGTGGNHLGNRLHPTGSQTSSTSTVQKTSYSRSQTQSISMSELTPRRSRKDEQNSKLNIKMIIITVITILIFSFVLKSCFGGDDSSKQETQPPANQSSQQVEQNNEPPKETPTEPTKEKTDSKQKKHTKTNTKVDNAVVKKVYWLIAGSFQEEAQAQEFLAQQQLPDVIIKPDSSLGYTMYQVLYKNWFKTHDDANKKLEEWAASGIDTTNVQIVESAEITLDKNK